MSKNHKKQKDKDSWSTTSESSRSSSRSLGRNRSKNKIRNRSRSQTRSHSRDSWDSRSTRKSRSNYSDFSSHSEDELRKKKYSSSESLKKGLINRSLTSIASNDSIASSQSNKSTYGHLDDDFNIPLEDLPLNVLQLLLSIRKSEINVRNLKLKHEFNLKKLKKEVNNSDLKLANEKISENLVRESSELISLNSVIYGENHLKLAWAFINLAQVYSECKNLPKQAKSHCETAFKIQIDFLKKISDEQELVSEDDLGQFELNDQKYQMILNYVYGKACSSLKDHEEAEGALEKAEEYFQNWKTDTKKLDKFKKTKPLFYKWQKKVYLALAKEYAFNRHYSSAFAYYEKLEDSIERKRLKYTKNTKNIDDKNPESQDPSSTDDLFIEILEDKAMIENKRDNQKDAAKFQKEAIRIAEYSGSLHTLLNCQFNLAKIYSSSDDLNSFDNAERLFKDCTELHEKNPEVLTLEILKIKEEFVKFYLTQDRYEDCCNLLNSLIKEQVAFSGPYSVKLSQNYKLLCSVYLKKNDMPNAAKFLQKSLEFEEMNYGLKDKRTLATKETLDELKKNPSVKEKLKIASKQEDSKPNFHAGNNISYYKNDLKVYSKAGSTTDLKNAVKQSDTSQANTSRTDSFLSNINPLN